MVGVASMLAAINPIDKIFIGVVELLSIVTRTPAFAAPFAFRPACRLQNWDSER
jgi:hypothetical protein